MKSILQGVFAAVLGIFLASDAGAGELVHQFVDPGFGGSPFNSGYVLGISSAQDTNKDPHSSNFSPTPGLGGFNPYKPSFKDLVQSSLQQRLATKIVNNLLGEGSDTLKPGTYTVGNNHVNISNNASGGTVVTIVDPQGKTTQIEVPQY